MQNDAECWNSEHRAISPRLSGDIKQNGPVKNNHTKRLVENTLITAVEQKLKCLKRALVNSNCTKLHSTSEHSNSIEYKKKTHKKINIQTNGFGRAQNKR
jgi:hypothetical protein